MFEKHCFCLESFSRGVFDAGGSPHTRCFTRLAVFASSRSCLSLPRRRQIKAAGETVSLRVYLVLDTQVE